MKNPAETVTSDGIQRCHHASSLTPRNGGWKESRDQGELAVHNVRAAGRDGLRAWSTVHRTAPRCVRTAWTPHAYMDHPTSIRCAALARVTCHVRGSARPPSVVGRARWCCGVSQSQSIHSRHTGLTCGSRRPGRAGRRVPGPDPRNIGPALPPMPRPQRSFHSPSLDRTSPLRPHRCPCPPLF